MINNFIIVISAPSGAGKTTIAEMILKKGLYNLQKTVSHTSREIRKGEVNGVHYFFKTRDEMLNMIATSSFIEFTEIYGNYYGTSKNSINEILENRKNPLLIIDWIGLNKLKIIYGKSKIISFFILPPSIEELKFRLINRGDDNDSILKRIDEAKNDIEKNVDYDYKIINNSIEKTSIEILNIIKNRILGKI